MAAISTIESSDHHQHLQLSSIPVVDLRFFSQSELKTLSLCSDDSYDLRRSDDIVIPKIDRSIFNESAGSRKQTYYRLRLARRPSDVSTPLGSPRRRRRRRSDISSAVSPDNTECRENSAIVSHLRKLFSTENSNSNTNTNTNSNSNSNSNFNSNLNSNSNSIQNPTLSLAPSTEGGPKEAPSGDGGRKRGRRRRRRRSSGAAVVYNDEGLEIVNRRGVAVDIEGLAKREDPFAAEMRRRTEGLATAAEMVRFLDGLQGQWLSCRRKKKIVDAGNFGDELPRGWKLMVTIKKREGRVWLQCRKYIRFSLNSALITSFRNL